MLGGMTTWRVIELAKKPAGYADHKPPYDFKHGWVPVTGAAKTEVAKSKKLASPSDITDEIKAKLPPMLRQKTWQHKDEQDWLDRVNRYREEHPEGFGAAPKAPDTPLADTTPPVPAKRAPRKATGGTKGKTSLPASVSETQRLALTDPEYDSSRLTPEWESAVRQGKLDADESEAIHQWQNGFTEVPMGDDEDEVSETGLYLVLNDMLRNGGQYDLGALDDEDLENLDLMNERLRSALDKSEVTRDTTVFRGVSSWGDAKVGDVVTDSGWQAASYDPSIAEGFLGGATLGAKAGKGSKMLVITLPKGSKALRVRERAAQEKVFGIKHEVAIGPDTPLRLTGIKGNQVFLEVQLEKTTELSSTGVWQVIELSSDHSSSIHPWPKNKPRQNWVDKAGGLPDFIKRVAKHIMADSGYTQSRAIAAAVSQCKKGRLGAKGLAAYAEFKAKAAAARAS